MPDFIAKQSTAITVVAGPFRDVTAPATKLTGLTITPSDIQIRKEGESAFAAKTQASNATHLSDGYYLITFNAADGDTLGVTLAQIDMTGAFPVDFTIEVITSDEWDRRYSTGTSTQELLTAIQKLADYPIAEGTIATYTADDNFTISSGSSRNDAYNGFILVSYSATLSTYSCAELITDYVGSTKQVLLQQQMPYKQNVGDTVRIYFPTAANIAKWLGTKPLALTSQLVQAQGNQLGTQAKTDVNSVLTTYTVPTLAELNAVESNIRGIDDDTLKSLSNQLDAFASSTSPQLLLNTYIGTLASQTEFTLPAGSTDDNAYTDAIAIITDASNTDQKTFVQIADYVGSTRTITLAQTPKFTIAVNDTIDIVSSELIAASNTGNGPYAVTLTFEDSATSDPIQGVSVRMRASAAEDLRGVTDVNGQVTFYAQALTYTITATLSNYTLDDTPVTLAVSGDATPTAYTMTSLISIEPSDDDKTTGYATCYNEDGVASSGIQATIRLFAPHAATGIFVKGAQRTETSGVDGVVSFTNLFKGAKYQIRKGNSNKWETVEISTSAGDSVALDSVVLDP